MFLQSIKNMQRRAGQAVGSDYRLLRSAGVTSNSLQRAQLRGRPYLTTNRWHSIIQNGPVVFRQRIEHRSAAWQFGSPFLCDSDKHSVLADAPAA